MARIGMSTGERTLHYRERVRHGFSRRYAGNLDPRRERNGGHDRRQRIERCGIRAVATGGYTSGLQAEAPTDVQVCVLKSTLDEARQALAELRQSGADDLTDDV